MTVRRKIHEFWTMVERIVFDRDGEPQVHSTTCCCKAAGAMRRICARASGNKTPCRCACHTRRVRSERT